MDVMRPRIIPPDAYRALFENSMDAVLLTVPDNRIVAANPAACTLFGMTEAELCASTRDMLIDTADPRFSAYLEERRRQGRARVELTYKRRNGGRFIGEATSVIFDHGQWAFVIIRDVTVQNQADEALRGSEDRARRIIDNLVGFVGILTPDGTLIEVNGNALRAAGSRREDEIGKKFWDCSWWNYDVKVQGELREAVARAAKGEVVRYDAVARVAGDGRMPIDFMLAPARNSAGRITHLIPSALDISERKQSEDALKEAKAAAEDANRAKSEFLANMGHELRTPLTVIMGAMDFLKTSSNPGERNQLLELADTSAHRLLGVIDDLLDISKIEARQLKIEEQLFDLHDCIRQAVTMFARSAQEKGLRLHWSVDPQLPRHVYGDPGRLGQVLINLVGNAVKFTREGEVEVLVTKEQGEMACSIRDTGIGIPAEKIGLLFQPFTQVDSSSTRPFGGSGLGLAICKELLGLMAGRIEVESAVGKGSTFTFHLPLRPVQTSEKPSPDGESCRSLSGKAPN